MRTWVVGCALVVALTAMATSTAWAESVLPVTPHAWCYAYAFADDPGQPPPGPSPIVVEDWNHASATTTPPLASASVDCDVQADGSLLIHATSAKSATFGSSNAKIIRDDTHDSTVTIGTSTEYPAGTPLLLNVRAWCSFASTDFYVFHADGTQAWRFYYLDGDETTQFGVVAGEVLGISLVTSNWAMVDPGYANMSFSVATPEPASLGLLFAAGLLLRRR